LRLVETPAFRRTIEKGERVRVPLFAVASNHARALILGTVAALVTFVLFYLMTVFALSWATSVLGYPREQFLIFQMTGVLAFAATIPLSALLADRIGHRTTLIMATLSIIAFGFAFAPLFAAGSSARVLSFLLLGFCLIGFTYGPLGSALAVLFPTPVRYTGTSLAFNLAGILGASLAPYIATWLASHFGLAYVGYYLSGAGIVTLIAFLLIGAIGSSQTQRSVTCA
jgi:MFS family permease